jgi:hypothetical protein
VKNGLRAFAEVASNFSIERTSSSRLRLLPAAAHVERWHRRAVDQVALNFARQTISANWSAHLSGSHD